jgi:peptidyl-prolyl cis-trans isomerase A (cyclophilin A)
MRFAAVVATAVAALALAGVAAPAQAKAPAKYTVQFTTTKGRFDVMVQRAWAPNGADRFYELVRAGYYDGDRLFRVIPGFVVQFGINPKPSVSKKWANATIKDDKVRHTNAPGTITFAATNAPNSRTTQVFVNLANNGSNLDNQGFAPFGQVTHGMNVLRKLYSGYAEQPTSAQQQMTEQGEPYLKKAFPKLDVILRARVVAAP